MFAEVWACPLRIRIVSGRQRVPGLDGDYNQPRTFPLQFQSQLTPPRRFVRRKAKPLATGMGPMDNGGCSHISIGRSSETSSSIVGIEGIGAGRGTMLKRPTARRSTLEEARRSPVGRARDRQWQWDVERLEPRDVPSALPNGFSETTVASNLSDPTAMEIAPDGRIFVAEQDGRLRVI